jgi:hypothetical protein
VETDGADTAGLNEGTSLTERGERDQPNRVMAVVDAAVPTTPRSVSEAVLPRGTTPPAAASLNLVGTEPQARAAAPPSVDKTISLDGSLPGTPSSVPAYVLAARAAWARTQDQLSLEIA